MGDAPRGQVKRKELFKFLNAFKLITETPMNSTKLNQKEVLKYCAIFFMQQQQKKKLKIPFSDIFLNSTILTFTVTEMIL